MSARTPKVIIEYELGGHRHRIELRGRTALGFLTWHQSPMNAHKYVGFYFDSPNNQWAFKTYMNRGAEGYPGELSKDDLVVNHNMTTN